MVKILVTGGRDNLNSVRICQILDWVDMKFGVHCIVHGHAKGADAIADAWANRKGIERLSYPVTDIEWKTQGKKAGLLRNQKMLDIEQPDLVIAFDGGRGTLHMTTYAAMHGYPMIIDKNGVITLHKDEKIADIDELIINDIENGLLINDYLEHPGEIT